MGERRRFSQELKKKAVQQMQQGCNVTALARELGVRRKLLYEWRDRMAGRPVSKGHVAKSGAAAPAAATPDWKQVAGTLALENRFLAQALRRVEERRRNSAAGSSTVSGKKSGPSTSSKAD